MIGTTGLSTTVVGNELQNSSHDVGTLCRDQNINKWSAHKPVAYTKNGGLTEDEWKSINYGLVNTPYWIRQQNMLDGIYEGLEPEGGSFSPISDITQDTYFYYVRPSGGSKYPYRLGDFRNYNKNAYPLIGPLESNQIELYSDNSGVLVFDLGADDDTACTFKNLAVWAYDSLNPPQNPEHLPDVYEGYRYKEFSDLYLGCYLYNKTTGESWFKTQSTKAGQVYTYNASFQITPTDGANLVGTWEVGAYLTDIMIANWSQSGAGSTIGTFCPLISTIGQVTIQNHQFEITVNLRSAYNTPNQSRSITANVTITNGDNTQYWPTGFPILALYGNNGLIEECELQREAIAVGTNDFTYIVTPSGTVNRNNVTMCRYRIVINGITYEDQANKTNEPTPDIGI